MKVKSESCSGCGLCSDVCTKGAINFKRNGSSYGTAEIDQEKCSECGSCKAECPKECIYED